jgi:hypothetical protein
VRVYALENLSFSKSVCDFHNAAFRKGITESVCCVNTRCTQAGQLYGQTGIFELPYPLVNLLQTKRCFRTAIILILVEVQNLLVRARQSSSSASSVRDDSLSARDEAHKARRDCCNPVPSITISHGVSLKESIVHHYCLKRSPCLSPKF